MWPVARLQFSETADADADTLNHSIPGTSSGGYNKKRFLALLFELLKLRMFKLSVRKTFIHQ